MCRRGDDYQDDPIMVEFSRMDKERQNPPEEMQSEYNVHSNAHILPLSLSLDLVEFTDEEGYGKFLDLHAVYSQYLNIKRLEVCTV